MIATGGAADTIFVGEPEIFYEVMDWLDSDWIILRKRINSFSSEYYRLRPDGSELSPIVTQPSRLLPTDDRSTWLAFTNGEAGDCVITAIQIDTLQTTCLKQVEYTYTFLRFFQSPHLHLWAARTEEPIEWCSDTLCKEFLYVADLDGSNAKQLYPYMPNESIWEAWATPDGEWALISQTVQHFPTLLFGQFRIRIADGYVEKLPNGWVSSVSPTLETGAFESRSVWLGIAVLAMSIGWMGWLLRREFVS